MAKIYPYTTKLPEIKPAAQLGKKLLEGQTSALVVYKKQKWEVADLLSHLADTVSTLQRTQCKPSAKCLFEGQRYMDEKFLKRASLNEQSK